MDILNSKTEQRPRDEKPMCLNSSFVAILVRDEMTFFVRGFRLVRDQLGQKGYLVEQGRSERRNRRSKGSALKNKLKSSMYDHTNMQHARRAVRVTFL